MHPPRALPAALSAYRAAKYSRVSDDTRGDQRSVADQDYENDEQIGEHGWTTTAAFCDNDRSASRFAKKDRPDWARLLAAIPSRQWDVTVLWSTARGDRTAATWLQFLDLARDHIPLVYITSHDTLYDLRKRRDYKTLAYEGIDNADTSEQISEQVNRTVRRLMREGAVFGRRAYGYRRTYDERTGNVTGQYPDPDTAPIAIEIIERYAAFEAVNTIIASLAERGIPSSNGKTWSHTAITLIVTNPVYIGKRLWVQRPGEYLDGSWPPLISEELHWACVERKTGRSTGTRPGGARWPLSLIATCGKCGACLTSQNGRTDGGRRFYTCRGNGPGTPKGCTSIIADWLETWVVERLKNRLVSDDIYEQLTAPDQEASAQARGRASELRQQLAKARAAVIALTMTIESFTEIEASLAPAIKTADAQAKAMSVPPILRTVAGQRREVIDAEWERMTVSARRELICAVIAEIKVDPAAGADRHSHNFNHNRIRMRWAGDDQDS